VAHVLWGGLLLFVAVALPLSFVNRYALWVSSVLGRIGVGLFIDEVGKFITQGNDYFFPLAFPIIYFLTSCFLELYALLEAVGQVFLLVGASLGRWRFLGAASRQLN
jgi:hypothetical protein